jgi:hypothetical protein
VSYERAVSDARAAALKAVVNLGKLKVDENALMWVTGALDTLNKAWDQLTDALVRQRDERDDQIRRLINELAERRGKT